MCNKGAGTKMHKYFAGNVKKCFRLFKTAFFKFNDEFYSFKEGEKYLLNLSHWRFYYENCIFLQLFPCIVGIWTNEP